MVVRVTGLGGARDEAAAQACFSKSSVQTLVPESSIICTCASDKDADAGVLPAVLGFFSALYAM